ncbi:hypothetical protein GCM10011408_18210 [Dyella caseinilytica]|nr:hypothetical protein GCM10011408_18210 [Dyella caseinilytica]
MEFKPSEQMHIVTVRKSGYEVIFVLPNALDQIAGDANVKRASTTAGKYVYTR